MGRPTPAASAPDLVGTTSSPWETLTHAPPFDPGTMLLASDGTVLVHAETPSGGTSAWYKLTPSPDGGYVDGTWSRIASMPGGYDPLHFASAILPNGQMIVEGGEYLGGTPVWTNKGAVYNPATNQGRAIAPPASISSTSLVPGQTASLSGAQLAGLSQGAAYGDDVQDNTNFPLVRIRNSSSGEVTYARTSKWTSVSTAPGAVSSTNFTVPDATPSGPSTLVVVANGISSAPVPVTIR